MAITNFVISLHTQHTINPASCSIVGSEGQSIGTCSCTCHATFKFHKQLKPNNLLRGQSDCCEQPNKSMDCP